MSKQARTLAAYHPWTTYIYAREEARRLGDRKVGTEHLVLGLLHEPNLAAALASDLRSARDALAALDRDSLAAIGLGADLDVPSAPVNFPDRPSKPTLKAVLQDHLRLTPAAKLVLRDAARPVSRGAARPSRRGVPLAPEQVLVRLLDLEQPDPAAALFSALRIDRTAVRARLAAPAGAA